MTVAPEAATVQGEGRWVVPLADVRPDAELEEAVLAVVRSGWWSMGPCVAELEQQFASFCGVRHAFAVANGTAALHLALAALGCGPGDEVIVPSLNFVAAANTIRHAGATPVFCDVIGAHDLTASPEDVEAAVTPATRAIVAMHYGGHPCRMEGLYAVAARHGLAIVEDAAHAPGASWRGRPAGSLGAVGCFSFFANKNLPTGEGGMVVTDDPQLAERIRLLRSHGMTTLTWDRHRGHAHSYDVVAHGYNYRLDEIRSAIALVHLGRLEAENAQRARLAARYREELHGVHGIAIPFVPDEERESAHHLAVAVLPPSVDRDGVREALRSAGVQTSVHYPPIHGFSVYEPWRTRPLPVTEDVAPRLVTLPLFPHMTDAQLGTVTRALLEATA